ncbi:MAG: tRNA pseudouridine(38-40) synthase TruA [bacterium]
MIIKLVIQYDGTNYYGFQHQDNLINIEDELVKAINNIDKTVNKVYGSGRTDRYVHAKGQVVHFETNIEIEDFRWMISINSFLPQDIRIISVKHEVDSFHARFNALGKRYSYLIKTKNYSVFDRNYYGNYPNINLELMDDAIKELIGEHDFKGFCSSKINELKSTIRTIYEANIINHKDYIEIAFYGNGFLRYQIRKMVGSLIDVGMQKLSKEDFIKIITSKDPKLSNKNAQAQGLYLMEVIYEGE